MYFFHGVVTFLVPYPRISKLRGYQASVGKFEIYRDRGSQFHRFTIHQEWTVAPLLDGFYRGRQPQGMSAYQHEVLDLANLGDA
jgi:hypothetical protein